MANLERHGFLTGSFALFLCGCALLLGACGLLRDGGMSRDVGVLLGDQDTSGINLSCTLVGRTRTGSCTFTSTPAQVNQLVSGMNLQTVIVADDSQVRAWQREGGCVDRGFDTGATVYRSGRRDPAIRPSSGGQFEYLLLYVLPDNRACVQVSYAYG